MVLQTSSFAKGKEGLKIVAIDHRRYESSSSSSTDKSDNEVDYNLATETGFINAIRKQLKTKPRKFKTPDANYRKQKTHRDRRD